jgi:uncharacterized protein
MDSTPAMPPPLPVLEPPKPWGFGATIGFSILIAVGYLAPEVVMGIVVAIIVAARSGGKEPHWDELTRQLESDGGMLAVGTLASAPFVVGLVAWFASMRRGLSIREYLGLQWPEWKVTKRWVLALFILIVISDGMTSLVGRPVVHEFMVEAYTSAGAFKIFLWLALMVAAPLSEEFLFRGFLFVGLARSWLRDTGTILVTSLLWAVIHAQYDWFGVSAVFLAGLLLGAARLKTGSLWLCVVLHGVMNLVATIEVAVLVAIMN